MAMFLKKTHELLALKASLRVQGREPQLLLELESNEGGVPNIRSQWRVPARAVGVPQRLERREMPFFALPNAILDEVQNELSKLELPWMHPLWLHLVKPYGYLGVMPWEQVLVPVINRPLLRLPDFLERPRENRSSLDVALCCSAPLSEPVFSIPDVLEQTVGVILTRSPRKNTRIHIFADAEAFDALEGRFTGESRVAVHDPAPVAEYGEQERNRLWNVPETGSVRCWWLRWMRDAMRGRSLDTVHFVCHGYLGEDRPALVLAESPLRNRDPRAAHLVFVGELASFLTQTGAWSATFSDLPNNYSEPGLRLLADTLAQTRPGPVLYQHGLGLDALGDAYQFLFAPEASQAVFAATSFIYCQPALVSTQEPVVAPARVPAVDANSELFDAETGTPKPPRVFRGGKPGRAAAAKEDITAVQGTPNWLAATQRFVEGAALDIQRQESDLPRRRRRSSGTANDATQKTLEDLQRVVADFARKSRPTSP